MAEDEQLVWVGPEFAGAGSTTFEVADVPLQHGDGAPLLCLSAVETVPEGRVCVPEIDCSGYRYVHKTYQLDAALLEIVAAPTVREQSLAAPGQPPCMKPRKRLKRSHKHGGLALGPSIRVKGQPKRVRRCKTG